MTDPLPLGHILSGEIIYRAAMAEKFALCETEAEVRLMKALLELNNWTWSDEDENERVFARVRRKGLAYAQFPLDLDGRRIRVDFLIVIGDLWIVVEVDGHDFHERTKEQAARDRSRDRACVRYGFRVLRFTGLEVFEDPKTCAREVDLLVQKYLRGELT